jgi:hypothetical protein
MRFLIGLDDVPYGNVKMVSVNGGYAGGFWMALYQLDITKWIKEGDN